MSVSRLQRWATQQFRCPRRSFGSAANAAQESGARCWRNKPMEPINYEGPLHGKFPTHACYILLHASRSPTDFPSRMSSAVQRNLQLRVLKWGGIVNYSWFGSPLQTGKQSATAFSRLGGRLEIPDISLESMDEVEDQLRKHIDGPLRDETSDEIHIYVCTHGARDCRCGHIGSQVVQALRSEVARRVASDPTGPVSRIKIGEVGHIGGHQFAANALIFPHGEWLGRLKPEDACTIIDSLLKVKPEPLPKSCFPFPASNWRGRTGFSMDDIEHIWRQRNP